MVVIIVLLIVVGTSIWVLADSSRLGARKGLVPGTFDMGPGGWFFTCLLLWIIGFPCYLATRPSIIKALEWEKQLKDKPRKAPIKIVDQVEQWERNTAKDNMAVLQSQRELTAAASAVGCPLCGHHISALAIRVGTNKCPRCTGEFQAESD